MRRGWIVKSPNRDLCHIGFWNFRDMYKQIE